MKRLAIFAILCMLMLPLVAAQDGGGGGGGSVPSTSSSSSGGGGGGIHRPLRSVCGDGECNFEKGESMLLCPEDCVNIVKFVKDPAGSGLMPYMALFLLGICGYLIYKKHSKVPPGPKSGPTVSREAKLIIPAENIKLSYCPSCGENLKRYGEEKDGPRQ